MRISIDTDKITIEKSKWLFLLATRLGVPLPTTSTIQSCIESKLVDYVNGKVLLTKKGYEELEHTIVDSGLILELDRFDKLATKLREVFPEGKKPGTNLYWRDSLAGISKKLKALVKRTNARFTDEEAIDAAKRYVASFNGNYQYMQVLKYFISKQVIVEGTAEEGSQFLSYLENKDKADGDWQTELR